VPDDATPPSPSPSPGLGFTPPTVEALQAILPDYKILEFIGAGGMGAIYKALHPRLNRQVAIKILQSTDLTTFTDIGSFTVPSEETDKLIQDTGAATGANYYKVEISKP